MQKTILRSRLTLIMVMLLAVAALTGCSATKSKDADRATTAELISEIKQVGIGNTVFPFEVTDNTGKTTKFEVHTNDTTVGAALLSAGLIAGETFDYGLQVTTVNGITLDFDIDKAYWGFFVDGAYAVSGVDTTDIEPGKVYSFISTKS
jgi:ABC-type amino acid transport substrate-binding protein